MVDVSHRLSTADVELLIEAARWAPSAGVLIASLCHRFVENTEE